jgi:hypothetical protein
MYKGIEKKEKKRYQFGLGSFSSSEAKTLASMNQHPPAHHEG